MNDKPNYMPSLLDKEIKTEGADAFGHKHFAKALESLIESPQNIPPYSIGLLGKWGTGKSSIKELYLDTLSKSDDIRKKKYKPIIFNAWQYGGENIKRALLRQVYLGLDGSERNLNDILFHIIQRQSLKKRPLKEMLSDYREMWIWSLTQFIIISLIILVLKLITGTSDGTVIGTTSVGIILGNLILQFIQNPERNIIKRFQTLTHIKPPSSSAEEYEDLLIYQLNKFNKRSRNCERIIVFVDDLDRLSAEEMICGLDTIRTFMEIPTSKLPKGLGIIFVISCDEDRIAEALANRRNKNSKELPGSVFNQTDARRFLDRIFQFRLEIPQFPKQDMRSYISNKLKTDLSGDFFRELDNFNVDLERLITRMIHADVQSPRNALQITNCFLQCWWLAVQRETENIEIPGGLQNGAVTNYPETLAAICVLKVDFPDFFKDLQKEPSLFNSFTNVFINKIEKIEDQNEFVQPILSRYCKPNEKNELTNEVSNDFRMLRQYISSLRDLKRPLSLQPFLLLSQDPLTRKHGTDRANRVFDSLISGDYDGVEEEFNIKHNAKLTFDNVLLLHRMEEDLKEQPLERQKNAAIVIGNLAEFIPETNASLLLNPLSEKLYTYTDLVQQLGLQKIKYIINYIEPINRQKTAYCLIDIFLKSDIKIDYELKSGEKASLNQLQEIVIDACSLILSIRKTDGLKEDYDNALFSWLKQRQIVVSDEEKAIIPFKQVEIWMDEHEEHLLPIWSHRYTELLYEQIISQTENPEQNIDHTIDRCRRVFKTLWESNNFVNFFDQINKFVSVKNSKYVCMVRELAETYFELWEPNEATEFINHFSKRLNQDIEDQDNWSLENWELESNKLISFLGKRPMILNSSTQDTLMSLLRNWSTINETGNFFIKVLELPINTDFFNRIIKDLTDNPLTELADDCLEWIGRYFGNISTECQNQVTSQLLDITKNQTISEKQEMAFCKIVNNLSDSIVISDSIQSLLADIMTEIPNHINELENHLKKTFPSITKLHKLWPVAATGSMLQSIFVNDQIQPSVLGWFHIQLSEIWPLYNEEMDPYDPSEIFRHAKDIAKENQEEDFAESILNSLYRMVKFKIVPDNFNQELIDLACSLWPFHPKQSQEVILSFNIVPTELSYISNLSNGISINDDYSNKNLSQIWSHFSKLLPAQSKNDVAINLLNDNESSNNDIPIKIWIEAQKETKSLFLQSLITESRLTDSQRKCIWLESINFAEELGVKFFVPIILTLFQLNNSPETIQSIFDSQDRIVSTFTKKSDQKSLNGALIIAYSFTISPEVQNRLLIWINRLGARFTEKDISGLISEKNKEIQQLREKEFNPSLLEKVVRNLFKKGLNETASTKEKFDNNQTEDTKKKIE
jgi:hypothetical protein